MAKIAVVLFNLGGPDAPGAVRPFLFNLFNDPAIIALPGPLRWLLAQLISRRRAPIARKIYAHLGGKSPLLDLTREQAAALEKKLNAGRETYKTFVSMRYWHPMSAETARAVKGFEPDEIVLLPLYPQYSSTTTGSSLWDWQRAAARESLFAPTFAPCCYPTEDGFIRAYAELVRDCLARENLTGKARVLFSAHGLPQKVIDAGDPYQWQVEQTAAAIVAQIGAAAADWAVCYQSRVGPLAWIGPSTEEELKRAAQDGMPVAVVPIAFVSEHSETLVELDIEYRHLAQSLGVPGYVRVPAAGTHAAFIDGLARTVEAARGKNAALEPAAGGTECRRRFSGCPQGRPL
ncbi:MAG: ferrochelatase [Rhodospirillales bacterium]